VPLSAGAPSAMSLRFLTNLIFKWLIKPSVTAGGGSTARGRLRPGGGGRRRREAGLATAPPARLAASQQKLARAGGLGQFPDIVRQLSLAARQQEARAYKYGYPSASGGQEWRPASGRRVRDAASCNSN
jgi:hypothetical protein